MAEDGPFISVIVLTYNWPRALDLVLDGLARQTTRRFEVVIADDGSGPETAALIEERRRDFPVALRHVWQADQGMRIARARNLAISVAKGDYLLCLDGDGLVQPGLVAAHARHAEPGWINAGRRANLSQRATRWALSGWLLPHRLQPDFFRALMTVLRDPADLRELSGPGRRRITDARRRAHPFSWQFSFGGHLGLWRRDCLDIGGFDERYVGWGAEDSDLVIRLTHRGVRIKQIMREQAVLHLYHPRRAVAPTTKIFEEVMKSPRTMALVSLFLDGPGRSPPEPTDRT